MLDASDPNEARQNPADYIPSIEVSVREALAEAKKNYADFDARRINGIGVDTTGSSPMPVDKNGKPLAFMHEFKNKLNVMVWLWEDHVPEGKSVACGEATMWGDYHARELALYIKRLALNEPYLKFYLD